MKKRIREEAIAIATGMYSMNAPASRFYGFNWNEHEITHGSFFNISEITDMLNHYNAFYDRETKQIYELVINKGELNDFKRINQTSFEP